MTCYGPWTQVQEHRERYGLRKTELADLAGISAGYMTMLENGQRWPTLKVTVKLARALGVSPAAIARRKKPEPTCRNPRPVAS
jgi:transcriptional regulator with XRE-family HTH domain